MTSVPLLSIVVPYYNVADYIEDCLESLRTQQLDDVEVILVDDGSRDASVEVARRFAELDPRFQIVTQENQGLGPARNTGVRHARGRYLTFVDSDDLVAPRAYARMVATLEHTGSDFAAGNAFRFSSAKGCYQSWTHRWPFRSSLLRTTLDATPEMMGDRMVWNKVYRRSFWDERGFAFPAIKYEDYPVTLRAYLEATSVDVLHDHVYFWRDRESGDSITQQRARIDNVKDRYDSAMMVLDVLEHHRASETVRELVHAYFIQVDLVTLAESIALVDPDDRAAATEMARSLAKVLPRTAAERTPRLARMLHRELLAGRTAVVADLARWRLGGSLRELGVAMVRRNPARALQAAWAVVPRRRIPSLRARKLKSAVSAVTWSGDDTLQVRVDTTLRGSFAAKVEVAAHLHGNDRDSDVAVGGVERNSQGLSFTVTVAPSALERLGDWITATLWIHLQHGPLRWQGAVRFSPDELPGARQATDGRWIQPGGVGMNLGLHRVADPLVVDRTWIVPGGFGLALAPRSSHRPMIVRRPWPTQDIEIDFVDGAGELALAELVAADPVDNLVTRVVDRPVVELAPSVRTGSSAWTDPDQRPVVDLEAILRGTSGDDVRPVLLAGDVASARVGDEQVSLTRGWSGCLVVRRAPVAVSEAEGAELSGSLELDEDESPAG